MKTLSLHLFEITSNSVFYGADQVEITVKDSLKENIYSFEVKDNGSGIRKEDLERVTDAFFTSRSSRKVGLGLALTKMKAEQCGGGLEIKSNYGEGTRVKFWFTHDNIDRPPLGEIEEVIVMSETMKENINLKYKHTTDKGEYVFDTKAIRKVLDEVEITNVKIFKALKEMIKTNLEEISVNE
ncbi:MAG: ATP-binding protein [Bacteroidales bacterium]|nr:ATP-binding protein [Bacteroidales bacterium]